MSNLLTQVDIGKEWIIGSKSIADSPQFKTPGALISIILKNVYTLAGILLLVLLIFGGLSIIMGAGGGDAKKAAQGKKAATTAVIGFLVVFSSYWVIKLVEFITGVNIFNPVIPP